MDRFELITVTFSFIVGLGIAQMLSACSLAFRNRSNQAINPGSLIWVLVILLFSVQYWFGLQLTNDAVETWGWGWYSLFLFLAVAIYTSGALVLPYSSFGDTPVSTIDFQNNGRFALLALAAYLLVWIIPNGVVIEALGGHFLFNMANLMNFLLAIGAVALFFFPEPRVQLVGASIYLLAVIFTFSLYANPSTTLEDIQREMNRYEVPGAQRE